MKEETHSPETHLFDNDAIAAIQGEHKALARLATAAGRVLRSRFMKFGMSEADAEDLAQETLVRAFKMLGEGKFEPRPGLPAAALMAWTLGIGRYVFLEHMAEVSAMSGIQSELKFQAEQHELGQQGAQEELLLRIGEPQEPDPELETAREGSCVILDESPVAIAIEEALEKLSPNDSMILRAVHFLNMKSAEIAAALKLSEPTVRKRLERARNRFRRLLEDDVRIRQRLPSGGRGPTDQKPLSHGLPA